MGTTTDLKTTAARLAEAEAVYARWPMRLGAAAELGDARMAHEWAKHEHREALAAHRATLAAAHERLAADAGDASAIADRLASLYAIVHLVAALGAEPTREESFFTVTLAHNPITAARLEARA